MKKVAIVTGASRGIGAATARLLGARGYAVAVAYHFQKAKAEEVAHSMENAIIVQADMGVEGNITRLFETVDKQLGPVTALVNNAAINLKSGSGTVEEMPWEDVESVFKTNVVGVFASCREAVKRMKVAGGGAIVNVSSEAGRFGGNKMTHYAASKAAVNTFTVAFAREAAAHKIRVNAVSPGVIDTGVHGENPERLATLRASLPLGRMGKPEEVAETIVWLLSDAASYVSGSILTVAGAR